MLRTIAIGSSLLIQGKFLETLSCGRIRIALGDRVLTGYPV